MATYTLNGSRFIRRYDAPVRTPVYSAASDAAQIAADICHCPWVEIGTAASVFPNHTEKALDANLETRDLFDAANFCTHHVNGMHLAHANVACYKFALPPAAVGLTLTSLTARISCDPYCRDGARVAINTNSTGVIPTACEDCRTGRAHAERIAPRTVSANGSTWYGSTADAVITPSSPIQLGSYLYVFITLETPSYSRDAWLEGAAKAFNSFEVTLSAAITGIADGSSIDCSRESREYNVCRGVAPGAGSVRSVALQASGDEIPRPPQRAAGESGLKIHGSSGLQSFIDSLPPGSVNNIVSTGLIAFNSFSYDNKIYNNYRPYEYVLVCGNFSGGSIPGLNGLYIYDVTAGEFVKRGELSNAYGYQPLAGLQLSDVGISYANLSGNGWFVFANSESDGTGTPTPSISLALVTSSGSTFSSTRLNGASNNVAVTFVVDPNDPTKLYVTHVDSDGYGLFHVKHSRSIGVLREAYGFAGGFVGLQCDGKIKVKQWNDTTNSATSFTSGGEIYGMFLLKNVGYVVYGSFSTFQNVSCPYGIALMSFQNDEMTVTSPEWGSSLSVDDMSKRKIMPFGERLLVVGDFQAVGGVPCNGAAIVDAVAGAVPYTCSSLMQAREAAGPYGIACAVSDGTFIVDAAAPAPYQAFNRPSVSAIVADVVDGVSTVTAEQSVIGLRAAYGRYNEGASSLQTMRAQLGVACTVKTAPERILTIAGERYCQTWQIASSALVVPFAPPSDYRATRIRIDLTGLDATVGSSIHVWLLLGQALADVPQLAELERTISDAVGEWRRIASIGVDGAPGEVEIPVDLLDCTSATLVLTARVSMDAVNPDDDTDSPQGVGTLAVNPITGAVTGSGFIPDITLIG